MQYFPVSKILGHRNILKESQGKINNQKKKKGIVEMRAPCEKSSQQWGCLS